MKKITDYTFVTGTMFNMEEKVKEMMDDGWQPFSSLSMTVLPTGTTLIQAMVKYEDDHQIPLGGNYL